MTGPQFHETRMGRVFFEVTLPRLVAALERLSESLERIAARAQQPEKQAGAEDKGEPDRPAG
jgi:hypothetical protein